MPSRSLAYGQEHRFLTHWIFMRPSCRLAEGRSVSTALRTMSGRGRGQCSRRIAERLKSPLPGQWQKPNCVMISPCRGDDTNCYSCICVVWADAPKLGSKRTSPIRKGERTSLLGAAFMIAGGVKPRASWLGEVGILRSCRTRMLEVIVRSGKEAANLQDEIRATVLDCIAAAKQRSYFDRRAFLR